MEPARSQALRGQRVVHLDRYSGRVLSDVGYRDYGAAGRVIEWGIQIHTGQQFGGVNQGAMAAACLAIVGQAVSAVVMWWKRRPVGRRSALNDVQSSMARLYFAGALSFIIASRAALNGLPSYQFGQRSAPASSLPTPYISCRSSTVPSSFQVAASYSSFGPW
mgnify:CR=1 FL=1